VRRHIGERHYIYLCYRVSFVRCLPAVAAADQVHFKAYARSTMHGQIVDVITDEWTVSKRTTRMHDCTVGVVESRVVRDLILPTAHCCEDKHGDQPLRRRGRLQARPFLVNERLLLYRARAASLLATRDVNA